MRKFGCWLGVRVGRFVALQLQLGHLAIVFVYNASKYQENSLLRRSLIQVVTDQCWDNDWFQCVYFFQTIIDWKNLREFVKSCFFSYFMLNDE